MDAESTPANPNSRGGILRWWIFAFLALPVVYVLSTGPVFRLLPHGVATSIYRPILFLAEYVSPFDDFLVWYIEDIWQGTM